MGKKNYGKSVKTRLLNLMNETGYKYMYLLARYFNERLLYRVSVSQYKDNFLLKGGSLLYAMDGLNARPTIDVDFMAERISRDREFLTKVFQEILGIVCDEDGVTFDTENITMEPITVEKKYPGTRFFFTAHMDSIIHKMSVDIGFGDVVTPYPASIDFPLLLPNIPSVNLQAYSLETVIAEKKNLVPGYFFSTVIGSIVMFSVSNVTPSSSQTMPNISWNTFVKNSLSRLILSAMKSTSMVGRALRPSIA
jgi:hypothetical protein